jgi:multiple sugar transport system substrate-binding protein
MKKSVLAGCATVGVALLALAGCTAQDSTSASSTSTNSGDATDGGKVLNIRCWNTEFQSRFRAYSTDFVKTVTSGTDTYDLLRDGTKVVWSIVANDNNGYQTALDTALANQDSADADDKIDLFLVEADYALKYTDSTYTLDVVNDIGLSEDELSYQYQYTKDIVTADSVLKGVSWQATPGLFAYRRDIAKSVLGTDDPTTVQTYLSDWAKFNTVAAQMKTAGYYMVSGYDDAYRAYSNNASSPWVTNKVVTLDPQIKSWIKATKTYSDNGYNQGTSLWDTTWAAGQSPTGSVFGYFYSTWGINFTLQGYADPSGLKTYTPGESLWGDWAVCQGPASYYWGGTWLCACKGTDNKSQVRSIMEDLTCSMNTMKQITLDTDDYTNNTVAMTAIADDTTYGSSFLGGQNHVALFAEAATKIDMSNICAYDQGCNEQIQTAMKDYFAGTITFDAAVTNFKTNLNALYNGLTYDSTFDSLT